MATVPFLVYLGDDQINGGQQAFRAVTEGAHSQYVGGLWGIYRAWLKFSRCIPADPTTGLMPSSPAYYPQWDGSFSSGAGAFVPYHHTNGTSVDMIVPVVPGCKGDNWYEAGGGITPWTMLMQAAADKWGTASPYFRGFKLAASGGFGSGSTPLNGNSAWTSINTQWTKIVTALGSDTAAVKLVVLDASYTDVTNAAGGYGATFEADLTNVIGRVRSKWGSSCLIMIVSPHSDMWKTSLPGAALFARTIIEKVAAANSNVVPFDMNWGTFAPANPTLPAPPADPKYYDTETYAQAGLRMFRAYDAWAAGAPTAAGGAGIAVFPIITDSQGKPLNPLQVVYSTEASLLGPVGGTVRAGMWIYDDRTAQIRPYDVLDNACTCPVVPTDPGRVGPECTAGKSAFRQFPAGVVFFKFALNGMAVTSEAVTAGAAGALEQAAATKFPLLATAWRKCKAAIVRDLDRTPDVQPPLVMLGDNDTYSDASAAAFAAKFPVLLRDLRSLLRTRSDGPELGIVCVQPHEHIANGGDSALGIATARTAVKAFFDALEDSDDRVRVITADPDAHEIGRDDRIHYGAEATYAFGYRHMQLVLELQDPAVMNTTSIAADVPAPTSGAEAATAAVDEAGSIASYKTPDLEVARRSADDLIKIDQYQRNRQAQRRGLRQTFASFD